jgi:hypothetical protein
MDSWHDMGQRIRTMSDDLFLLLALDFFSLFSSTIPKLGADFLSQNLHLFDVKLSALGNGIQKR